MNLPNTLTLMRVLLIPVFVLIFYLDMIPYNYMISGIIFVIAAFTDFLDGYIARKQNLVTNFGKFLDPIADKVLVSSAMIVLLTTPAVFSVSVFEGWGIILAGVSVAVILARELIVSGFRMIAAERKLVLAADIYGKIKTVVTDVTLVVLLITASFLDVKVGEFALGEFVACIGIAGLVLSAVLTVMSGANYLIKNKEVLKDEEKD